ncbi:MAG: hypothetical protein II117_01670 [Clostridia bacterium]|nr:hypothetical protein [Clostridia bacterium]
MKRLLCLLLTALMLISAAACSAKNPQTQPEEQTGNPADAQPEAQDAGTEAQPNDGTDSAVSIDDLPIQPIENPPIELTDPVQPIFETEGKTPDVSGYGDFSNLLSAAILSGTKNQNLSPISVYLALAMVTEGAKGNTQAELLKLLGCKDLAELRAVCGGMLETLSIHEENSTLELHDSLWMAKEIDGAPVAFREDFLKALADTYRSEANAVEFGTLSAAQQIADWINEQTRGKIDVKPEALHFDPSTLAVLINTIYLKDNWAETFDEKKTAPDTFYGADGETTVDYMHRYDKNAVIRQGDGWIAYRVYLSWVGYVTFVLPDEGVKLESLLGSPEAIDKLLHAGINRNCDVSLMIPKFKFQDKMELTEVLKALGLKLSFTPAADFSGISDLPARIDSVLQESYIGADENGIEAAAYTMISVRTTAYNPVELEKIDFHLTRPFFYAIETHDGTVLFIGTVTEPSVSGQN